MGSAAAARDLLACARARSRPTLSLCGGYYYNHVPEPFVVDDAVWGFSLETLQAHVNSASLIARLRASIDLVFINASSGSNSSGGVNAAAVDLRRLSSWESALTHFVFLINTDLSGNLQVTSNRLTYHLPLFNKGGSAYSLDIFIHEDTEPSCCDCGGGGDDSDDNYEGSNSSSSSVRWDLVCAITQSGNNSRSSRSSRSSSTTSNNALSSVLYASSWADEAIVDACVALEDERNPLVAFIGLAHVFLAAGAPRGAKAVV